MIELLQTRTRTAGLRTALKRMSSQNWGTAHRHHLDDCLHRLQTMEDQDDVSRFLHEAMARFELDFCVYHARAIPGAEKPDPVVITTYPVSWVAHYIERGYVFIDPVVRQAEKTILPIDWSDLDRRSAPVRRMFGESREFGIGAQGLTFSIRGPRGERALFSVNSHLKRTDWALLRPELMREMQMFAHYLHARVMNMNAPHHQDISLTKRESECLSLAAQGVTAKEIARVYRISPPAVRAYLDSARHKLHAVNRTHAAVIGARLGLI